MVDDPICYNGIAARIGEHFVEQRDLLIQWRQLLGPLAIALHNKERDALRKGLTKCVGYDWSARIRA